MIAVLLMMNTYQSLVVLFEYQFVIYFRSLIIYFNDPKSIYSKAYMKLRKFSLYFIKKIILKKKKCLSFIVSVK